MASTQDMNAAIIEEFRANEGRVGGRFQGAPLLLLHTRGARSDEERINPMMYQAVGDSYAVFASRGGSPNNPDWYHNLVANQEVTIEIGTETKTAHARVLDGDERERIWTIQKDRYPTFAEYEKATTREIPVILLEPK